MYSTIASEVYAYIFNHAEVKMIFVGYWEIYSKAAIAAEDRVIYLFDQLDGVANCFILEKRVNQVIWQNWKNQKVKSKMMIS